MSVAAVVAGQITPTFSFSQTPSTGGLANQALAPALGALAINLKNGNAAPDLVDLLSIVPINLVATTTTLDLTTLTDVLGGAVNLLNVMAMIFVNYSTVAGHDLLVGDAVTNEWDGLLSSAGTLRIPASSVKNPFGGFVIVGCPNGLAVSSSHKVLKVDSGANTVTGAILFVGASA